MAKNRTLEELKIAVRDYIEKCHKKSENITKYTIEEIKTSLNITKTEAENLEDCLDELEEEGLIVTKNFLIEVYVPKNERISSSFKEYLKRGPNFVLGFLVFLALVLVWNNFSEPKVHIDILLWVFVVASTHIVAFLINKATSILEKNSEHFRKALRTYALQTVLITVVLMLILLFVLVRLGMAQFDGGWITGMLAVGVALGAFVWQAIIKSLVRDSIPE